MKTIVTGGAGFIGRAVVQALLARGEQVVVLDALTYAAHPEALLALGDVELVQGDVADPATVAELFARVRPERVLHLAAESHVDRAITDAAPFVRTNVAGSWNVARAALEVGARLVHVSTDEVYGDRDGRPATVEGDPVAPTNAYAATKACADALVLSLVRAEGLDAVITRGVNTYGPGQFPEKLLPLAARRWLAGEPAPVYGDGLQVRHWLHVHDHAAGILAAADLEGGPVVHLGSADRCTNLEVLRAWRGALELPLEPDDWLEPVTDRPGHDRAYALDDRTSRQRLAWAPRWSLGEGLAATATWLRGAPDFWNSALKRPEVAIWFRSWYQGRR